jgi:hypothetical protein
MLKCITIDPISTVVSAMQTRRPIHNAHLIWSNKNTIPVMELQNFLQTTSCTYRVPLRWFRTYSTLVQTYTYDLFFFTFSNSPTLHVNSLYIWSEHYNHKVVGSRLFDHKKTRCNAKLFVWNARLFFFYFFSTFCYFLLPFLLLVTL